MDKEKYLKRILKKSGTIFILEILILSIGLLTIKFGKWLFSLVDKFFKWIGKKMKENKKNN